MLLFIAVIETIKTETVQEPTKRKAIRKTVLRMCFGKENEFLRFAQNFMYRVFIIFHIETIKSFCDMSLSCYMLTFVSVHAVNTDE